MIAAPSPPAHFTAMLYLNIWLTVKDPANVDEVRQLLSEQARLSRQESGCERFEVYQSNNDPVRFLLTERWQSQAVLDTHRTAHAYTTIYQPKILPLVNREPHPSSLVSG
jgi:quinol monooxygenase YgiN